MYNIVRHLVEGREGIETFNLSKTEHLNAYANQIRTSSFSVCCVCVCVCVCCSHSFGFGFGYFCSRSHSLSRIRFVFVFMFVLVFFGSLILVLLRLRLCFSFRFLRVCFQYYFISLLQVLCTSNSSFPVFFFYILFLFCVFVYTAEFLPIISPLRECTKRPSNSMVEFCLMLPVGVRRGSFSSLNKRK